MSICLSLLLSLASCETPTGFVPEEYIRLAMQPAAVVLAEGQTQQLTPPAELQSSGSIIWRSTDSSVAQVTSSGVVTAARAGTASIVASSPPHGAGKKYYASADVTVNRAEPPPVAPAGAAWMSADEIRALPASGTAWTNLRQEAERDCGIPDLSNQDDPTNVCILAKALVFARIGGSGYRDAVIAAIRSIVNSGTYTGRALALGRELGTYPVAAQLIDLRSADPALDDAFRTRLRELRTTPTSSGPSSLVECHEQRPNNWGLHCGTTRAAVAVYLGDETELARTALVFRGYLGDRSAYDSFDYGSDLSWQCDAGAPAGINPAGCVRDGFSIDGVLPDDQRRCGTFSVPPCLTNYAWEGLQGAMALAWILHRQGYDVFNWSDRALLRAFRWLHDEASFHADGDDGWLPHMANHVYGTSFPAPLPAQPGKAFGWTDWTHQR